ncbi:MAG: IS3 family transposase [Actinobacteria bacterium]|nr:IS3 family transposase [Actinomycetota bacterium]
MKSAVVSTQSPRETLETELLWQHVFRTRNKARLAIFDFVEAFYNCERLHSSIVSYRRLNLKGDSTRESACASTKESTRSGELHALEH